MMPLTTYAAYALLFSAVMLIVVIGSLGYDRAAFRFIPPLYASGSRLATVRLAGALVGLRLVAAAALASLLLWVGPSLPFLGAALASTSPVSLLALVLVIAAAEGLVVVTQALGLHASVATLNLIVAIGRALALLALAWTQGALGLDEVVQVTLCSEGAQASILLLACTRELYKHGRVDEPSASSGQSRAAGCAAIDWRSTARCCASAWGAYLCAMPTQGPALRLLVGVFADAPTLAAFAFFQQLSDRARPFLPLQLVLPAIETAVSARRATPVPLGVRAPQIEGLRWIALLVRINFLVICLGLLVMAAAGLEVERWVTGGRFADGLPVAALLMVQLFLVSLESGLWTGYNAAGDALLLNRASMLSSILAVPIVFAAAAIGGAVGVACVAAVRVPLLACLLLRADMGEPARQLLLDPHELYQRIRLFGAMGLSLGLTGLLHRASVPGLGNLAVSVALFIAALAALRCLRPQDLSGLIAFTVAPSPLLAKNSIRWQPTLLARPRHE